MFSNCERVIHLFSWSVIGMVSFPLCHVTPHPFDCILYGGNRQVWQGTLVAVEQRLSARKDPHQCLAKKDKHLKH